MPDDRSEAKARQARRLLALLALAMAACVGVVLTPDPHPPFVPPPGATSDLDVFRRIVECVRSGETFHDATQRELRSHGYPTRSVFNWRTPTYAWALAALPGPGWGRGVLTALAALTLILVCLELMRGEPLINAAVGGVAFVGATAWCVGQETHLFTELWAGILIALSVACLGHGWTRAGVLAGISALFARELSLPYVLVCLGLAAHERKWREAASWCAGLAVFLGFYAWHASVVAERIGPADQAIIGGWVRFGGMRFVLATAQTNVFLMGLPLACTAACLPLALLGLASWRGAGASRVQATLALYLTSFCIVGAPFNFYWGFVVAPLLALGLARAPRALGELLRAAVGGKMPARADLPGSGERCRVGDASAVPRSGRGRSPGAGPSTRGAGSDARHVRLGPDSLPPLSS